MNFFKQLLDNRIFLTAVSGWLVAQILKTIIHFILAKELRIERL